MDAVEFLKERARMCDTNTDCFLCPLKGYCRTRHNQEEAVRIVEEWSKKHRPKTNAQKFEEVFGRPVVADAVGHRCAPWQVRCATCECDECDEWWDEPYEAPEE